MARHAASTVGPHTAEPGRQEARLGQHIVSLAGTVDEQLDLLAPVFGAALASDCRCLFIADRTAPEAFTSGMVRRGCNTGEALASGQFQLLTSDRTYLRDGHFDADRMLDTVGDAIEAASEGGWGGLCGAGEVTWVHRGIPGVDRVVEYEYRLNELEGLSSAAIICLYDRERLPKRLGTELRKVHPLVHVNGTVAGSSEFVMGATRAAEVPLVEDLEPPADQLPCERLSELLSAYADGQMAPSRGDQIGRHLRTCSRCRREVETYRALKTSLTGLRTASGVDAGFWVKVRRQLGSLASPD